MIKLRRNAQNSQAVAKAIVAIYLWGNILILTTKKRWEAPKRMAKDVKGPLPIRAWVWHHTAQCDRTAIIGIGWRRHSYIWKTKGDCK